ncbi:MAG: CapA family protein [Firmicutes bacterium]|nr:CapA family protein [Bacillota bacterium]
MAYKPKHAKQKPRRNPAWKLLPLLAVAVAAVILIVHSVGGEKPVSREESLPAEIQQATTESAVTAVASATVGVQGDLLMHKPVINACALEDGGYDFEPIFRYVAEYMKKCDYSVANLETTLGGDGNPYQGYPHFNCPDEIVEAAKNAGMDMLLTVNNHASDTGTEGLLRTVKRVREMGLTVLGTQLSDEEPKYTVVDLNGIKVGMTAFTYATDTDGDGLPTLNYEAEVTQAGVVNYYTDDNLNALYNQVSSLLSQMKAGGAEATMVYMHWGTEYTKQSDDTYSLCPDATQKAIAQQLCDLGVDVIVGGHPHVVEPMELLTSATDPDHKTFVIYSLGNAVSNQRRENMDMNTGHTEDGAMFTVTFSRYSDGTVAVSDVDVLPTWVNMSSVNGKLEYNILPLDASRGEQWKSLYNLDDALCASAAASYDRTMNIVGPGLQQCQSYLRQMTPRKTADSSAA